MRVRGVGMGFSVSSSTSGGAWSAFTAPAPSTGVSGSDNSEVLPPFAAAASIA